MQILVEVLFGLALFLPPAAVLLGAVVLALAPDRAPRASAAGRRQEAAAH